MIFNPQHEYTKRLLADVPKLHEEIALESLAERSPPRRVPGSDKLHPHE